MKGDKRPFFPTLVWSVAVAFLFPLAFFFETFLLFSEQVKQEPIALIPIYWILLCGIPVFALHLIVSRFTLFFGGIFAAGATTFSLFFLKLEYVELFYSLSIGVRLTGYAVTFFLLAWFFTKGQKTREYPSLFLSIGLFALFVAAPYLSAALEKREKSDEGHTVLTQEFPGLGNIKLSQTPNFYVLMYDALLPGPVADVFFGEGSAAYYPLLEKNFYIPDGVTLQDDAPTKPSMHRVLWLDMAEATLEDDYFRGRKLSPLISIFRNNGYHVTTGFHGREWTGMLGPHIDEYLTQMRSYLKRSSLCVDHGEGLRDRLIGYGVCTTLGSYWGMPPLDLLVMDWLDPESRVDRLGGERDALAQMWYDSVTDHLKASAQRSRPSFSLIYTYKPVGHASPRHQPRNKSHLQEYKKRFIDRAELARDIFSEIVNLLNEIDPNAILLIAGDHGTMMARNSKNKGFRLVDRNSVAIGVLKSENECARIVAGNGFTPNKSGYHTIPTVILSLIQCLAGDNSIIERLPITPAFPEDMVGDNWEVFLKRNLSPPILKIFTGEN